MPYKLDLHLPFLPASLNRSLRSHWRKQRREGKRFDLTLAVLCRGKLPAAPLQKARISVIRHAHRQLDYDGLVGSLKPVVDALVTIGVLADDNWNVTGAWIIDQVQRPKAEGPLLTITVEEQPLTDADRKRIAAGVKRSLRAR